MSSHLSDDQFARCIVRQATSAELRHSEECPQCSAELNRFGGSLLLFQSAIQEQVDDRIARHPAEPGLKHSISAARSHRWVLVAAASVVLMVLPFIGMGNKPQEIPEPISVAADPEAVMNRVGIHLSRNVPGPMEPLLLGLPDMNP
jgi:hypothetical protein